MALLLTPSLTNYIYILLICFSNYVCYSRIIAARLRFPGNVFQARTRLNVLSLQVIVRWSGLVRVCRYCRQALLKSRETNELGCSSNFAHQFRINVMICKLFESTRRSFEHTLVLLGEVQWVEYLCLCSCWIFHERSWVGIQHSPHLEVLVNSAGKVW